MKHTEELHISNLFLSLAIRKQKVQFSSEQIRHFSKLVNLESSCGMHE